MMFLNNFLFSFSSDAITLRKSVKSLQWHRDSMQNMLDLIPVLYCDAGPEHCWIDGNTKPRKETVQTIQTNIQ